jgi:iron complex transport system ATP-binding protein
MNPALLELSQVSVVRGGTRVLEDITLTIDPGQHTAILGANGSGKSTLVQLVSRHLYPLHGGHVRIFGRTDWSVSELRRLIGIVSPAQERDFTSNEPLQAFEAVAASFFSSRGLLRTQRLSREVRRRTEESLERLGISHLSGRQMRTLSTGEARRVLIARALVHEPKALLLDEPCSGLDPVSRHEFLENLREIARAGTTLLLVTHHVEEILPEIGELIFLRSGRLFDKGEKREKLTSEKVSVLFGAEVEIDRQGEWYRLRFD